VGLLIDGRWHDQWYDTSAGGGCLVPPESGFRNWVPTTARPARQGSAATELKPGVIISRSLWPDLGRIGP
jgi:putative glutathione S-transferase